MTQTLEALRIYQFGKEGTRGTIVPATSKIAVEQIEFEPLDKVFRPKLAKGLAHRNPGSETVVTRGSQFKIPSTPVIYDQIQNFFGMSVKGGVASTGAPSVYTWLYPRTLTADPAPDTWSFERRITDGSTPKDSKWGYGFLSKIEFDYQADKPLMFSAEGYCRRIQSATLTAALALPTIEIPPVPLAQLWIDTTWAGLGGTAVTAQVLKAKVSYMTGLLPLLTFDGRSDLDYTSYIFDADKCGLDVELTLLVAGQYDTEKTAAEAASLRAMRLKVLGTGSRELTLDMALKHEAGSVFKVGSENGQDIVELKLQDTDDGTNMFQAKVVNAVSTLI